MASSTWALPQLARILPLDEQSLNEILAYTSSLSKEAAAEHLRDILGTSPKALEFITSFNSRREAHHPTEDGTPPAPDTPRKPRKKKAPLNKPFKPRQPEDHGNIDGTYQKKPQGDYMAASSRTRKDNALANTLSLSERPEARQSPASVFPVGSASLKKPPSASGPLISDLPNVRAGSRNASRTSSRTSSPAPKTTVKLSGGTPMQGTSSTLQDLVAPVQTLSVLLLICDRTPQSVLLKSRLIPPYPPTNRQVRAPALVLPPAIRYSQQLLIAFIAARLFVSKKALARAHSAPTRCSHQQRSRQ